MDPEDATTYNLCILCAGKGTRMKTLTKELPKALLPLSPAFFGKKITNTLFCPSFFSKGYAGSIKKQEKKERMEKEEVSFLKNLFQTFLIASKHFYPYNHQSLLFPLFFYSYWNFVCASTLFHGNLHYKKSYIVGGYHYEKWQQYYSLLNRSLEDPLTEGGIHFDQEKTKEPLPVLPHLIDATEVYEGGPLYSFLSIFSLRNLHYSDFFIIIPGDTFISKGFFYQFMDISFNPAYSYFLFAPFVNQKKNKITGNKVFLSLQSFPYSFSHLSLDLDKEILEKQYKIEKIKYVFQGDYLPEEFNGYLLPILIINKKVLSFLKKNYDHPEEITHLSKLPQAFDKKKEKTLIGAILQQFDKNSMFRELWRAVPFFSPHHFYDFDKEEDFRTHSS